MKKINLILSAILSFCMAFPTTLTGVVAQENEKAYNAGYTVEANTDEKYAADYQVTFVYEGSEDVESVKVQGNLQFYSLEDPVVKNYFTSLDLKGAIAYDAYEYKDGMFNTGYGLNSDSKAYEMEEVEDNKFQVTIPLPGNIYAYDYVVNYKDGSSKTIQDPVNPSPSNPANGHDSGHSLAYVGSATKTMKGQEKVYARTDGKVGKTEFVPYTAVDGSTQYIEVYTPYGYTTSQKLPVVYVSHGGGGNEAEWMHLGAVANILDNLIAEGTIKPTIAVTMDNAYFGWNYDKIKANLMDHIVPLMEEKYNVAKSPNDRAFCGLSMGGLTTTSVYQTLAGEFGYLGPWSATFTDFAIDKVENKDFPVLMLAAGCVDFGAGGFVTPDKGLKDVLTNAGVEYTWEVSNGAHDWGVWRDLFTRFATNYLWTKDTGDSAGVHTVKADNKAGYNTTFTYFADENVEKVDVTGSFVFLKFDECGSYQAMADNSSIPTYSVYDYEPGMFSTNTSTQEAVTNTYPMEEVSEGKFQVTLPLPASMYYYDYVVTYKDGKTATIKDPANMPVANPATHSDAGHSLLRVGSAEDTEEGQEYVYPRTDGQTGKYVYLPYTDVNGKEQYIAVYTPYGYDESKTYKTVYISHGGGGNEAEWMTIGAVPEIFDNLIAAGEVEPTVVVAMDNNVYDWDYDVVLPNVLKNIIPFVEKNFSVSKDANDRAFCGLSMGSMTTNMMIKKYPNEFGYFGAFSGGIQNIDDDYDVKAMNNSVIWMSAGCIDMAYNNKMGIAATTLMEKYDKLGINYTFDLYSGAHDWGFWRHAISTFAKDYLWDAVPNSGKDAGVTVKGNDVTFVFVNDSEKEIEKITVGGTMQWYSPEDPVIQNYWKTADATGAKVYGADEYKDGMINTGYGLNNDSVQYELHRTSTPGRFETTLTLPGSEYAYKYTITYTDGTSVTIQDPANPSPKNPANGHDSGNSLVWVGSADNCIKGQEYIYARNDKNGSFEYIPYKAVDGTTQYLGIYTPYGYDKTKEYKTVYISHGGGGNEAEWPFIGSATNIFDNLIAAGETEPAVYVTMDNTYFGWDYDKIAENFSKHIIPLVEANYAVSTKVEDRALCGLSMGALTTGTIMFSYTDMFGAYGCFSGCADPLLCKDIDLLKTKTIYLTGGNVDMAIQAAPDAEDSAFNRGKTVRTHEYLESIGVEHTYDLKGGAHDWGVWRESLTTFLKDVLWNTNQPTTPENGGTTGGTTTGGTTPSVGIYNNAAYVAVATIALAGAAYVALKKKED